MQNNWLVRKENSVFLGPMTREELLSKINAGAIQNRDEVCSSLGYWFGLNELDEVRKNLGDIPLLLNRNFTDDDTQTETVPMQTVILRHDTVEDTSGTNTETPTLVRNILGILIVILLVLYVAMKYWLNRYS